MGANITTFEVRVAVYDGRKKEYKPLNYYGKGEWIGKRIVKMFHIDARTHEQAKDIARKCYGKPLSCRKMDAASMLADIENIKLDQADAFGANNPYSSAVAMDEMVWLKRNKRRANMQKDKKYLDKSL